MCQPLWCMFRVDPPPLFFASEDGVELGDSNIGRWFVVKRTTHDRGVKQRSAHRIINDVNWVVMWMDRLEYNLDFVHKGKHFSLLHRVVVGCVRDNGNHAE